MKEIDHIIRASVRVILTRRDAKRANEDGASESARKKYGVAFTRALDELEVAVEAFGKAPKPTKPAGPPFDWNGPFRAVQAILRMGKRVRKGEKVEDIIEGEIIG
jgi:hypothetical protein